MAIFKGAGVAIVTPMREDRTVDFEQFTRLLEFQISNGTDAIIVCGTTGESSTLQCLRLFLHFSLNFYHVSLF